jgi:hypothetical protein
MQVCTLQHSIPAIHNTASQGQKNAAFTGGRFLMNPKVFWSGPLIDTIRSAVAVICIAALVPGDMSLFAQSQPSSTPPSGQESVKLPADQLDSLVAPIALYPDPLLSQTLVASTYPLEIIQLQQWLEKNKSLKEQALADAVKKQDWDPSIQALAMLPDVVKRLSENIKWTTDLGNAFLAQQSDVMDAVQRMRKKAQDTGNLKSSEQQKVETKVIENKQIILVEQANPEVVYVPSYNPTVFYGAPAYPYPPVYYPPPGYYAAGMAISFGVGMMMGAAWGGGWGWNSGWGGHNNVYINNNNNFVSNYNRQNNINNVNRGNRAGNSSWQHNPQHRGGAPYGDRTTARQYGGNSRGDSLQRRQESARRDQAQRGNRQQAGVSDRRAGTGQQEQAALRDRSTPGGRQQAGVSDRSSGAKNAGNRGGSGGDRVGNRSVSSGSGSRNSNAFGGGGGFSGSSARSSSARGSSSMGGGGGRRGGGRRR